MSDMLKNVLIVVDDIETSIEFYKDLFGPVSYTHLVRPDTSVLVLFHDKHLPDPLR